MLGVVHKGRLQKRPVFVPLPCPQVSAFDQIPEVLYGRRP